MKSRLFVALMFLICSSVNVFSQFILAGTYGSNDYYYDVNPDTSIYAADPNGMPYYDYPSDKDSLMIDLNGDNINDFELTTLYMNGDKWYQRFYTQIIPLNNNRVAISHFDSCFNYLPSHDFEYLTPMAKAFSAYDSINKYNTWIDSTAFLAFYDDEADYIICYHNSFSTSAAYLGLKVLIPNDTLYGWIEVIASKYDSIIVKEFACNIFSTGIGNHQNESFVEIFPNPATDQICIRFSPKSPVNPGSISVEIYNIFGESVGKTRVSSGKDRMFYDVSGLSNGIYSAVIKDNQKIINTEKFLIAR